MADWYYWEGDKREGPIPEQTMRKLLSGGLLPPDTLVWIEAFGSDRRQASRTQLVSAIPMAGVSSKAASSPTADAVALAAISGTSRRPVIWEWLIAFSPLALLATYVGLFTSGDVTPTPQVVWTISLCFAALAIWLAYMDSASVTRAGLNPPSKSSWGFILLSPIAYFLHRRVISGVSLTPLWIWLACFACYAFFSLGNVAPWAEEVNAAASTIAQSSATASPLKCKVEVSHSWHFGSLPTKVISCSVTADRAEITGITLNRGNCQAAKINESYKFGDSVMWPLDFCNNLLEYSIEVNGQRWTWQVGE